MNTTTSRITKNSKPKGSPNESNGNSAPHPEPERIAICAYLIWEQEDRPDGCEVAHWLQAEGQLRGGPEAPGEAPKS